MKNQYKIKNNKEKREKNKFTSQNILAFSFLILALIRHGWRCRNALAEVFVKQKLQRQKTAWMLFFAACSLLICNCDLFNNPKDPDYLKKIDEEIAWANAAKLNVSVAIPAGWGTSPQNGENKCFDIKRATERPRKGYPFNVEFMPGYGYGFIGWLAFEFTEEFKLESINSLDFIDAKPYSIQEGVVISSPEGTFTGSYTANITLNVSKNTAITLVPWCSSRPQVIQSNPPLINTGALYSLGQTITVYFSEPGLIYEAGPLENFFGEGFIQIKGQTMPKQIDEKITIYENLSEYYHTPVYNDELKTITIHADSLPVEEMSITVTVGPDIKGKNDSLMAAPVSFSWRTSTETVKETYAAQNIWAAHSPDTVTGEEGFFYARAIPGENNNYRDARLRKNNDGKYEINLYFSVRSNNEDLGDPNRCMVQEYRAYTLAGSNASSVGDAATYEITAIASPGSDPAANAYRSSNNNVKAYKITHTMDPEKYETGIWRLVLMPYLDEGGVQIGLDTWGNAHSDNAYAVVVLNNTLPTGTPILSLNAEMSGTGIYNYGADNQLLNFDVNFNSIVDRWASSGIMRDDGSYEKPWTIDAFSELTWQWRIVDETDSEPVGLPSSWISTGTRESGSNLTGVLSSTQNIYNIELCFRDTLGQASENWLKINVRFTYYESNYGDVSNYQAIYNPAVNTITVEWENPAESDFNHVEAWYKENGIEVKRADLDNKATVFVIRNVPRLDASGVRDGAAVQNIYCYEIFMKTHSVIDSMPALSFKIWNFCTSGDAGSGMKTGIAAGFSEAVEVIDAGSEYDAANKTIGLAKIASHDLSGQYVLADNINLNGEWMPIGDGDAAFQGIFYGNGKIISTASDFSFADNTYTGIFGFVQDAVIRDLAVHYAFSVDVSADSYKYTGGIAGFAAADTVVRNCIVTGGESTILKVTIPVAVGYSTYNGVALGGIIGCMESGVKIINACSALDIELLYEYESTGENYSTYTYAGGAVGYIVGGIDPELDTVILSGIRITGNVSMQSYNISYCFGGGAVGYCNSNGGKLYDVSFGGNLIMGRKNTYESGSIYGGGIVGFCVNPRFEECTFEQTGKIITLEDIHSSSNGTFNNSNWLYISGIAGSMTGDGTLKSCTARGGIDIRSLSVIYAGGIVGELADSSIHFSECNYENGRIFAKTKNVGRICLGGIVGYEVVTWGTEFQNCFSIGGQFEIDVNVSNLWIGGFGGMISGSEIRNCGNTSSIEIISISDQPDLTYGEVYMGGFAGQMESGNMQVTLENCWSEGNITSISDGPLLTGGLVGCFGDIWSKSSSRNVLKNCYATGDVTASFVSPDLYDWPPSDGRILPPHQFYTGGLVGYAGETDIIECWASGKVTARQENGILMSLDMQAGGLAGACINSTIKNSYALGDVILENTIDIDSTLKAGGLTGSFANGFDLTDPNYAKYSFAAGSVTARAENSVSEIYTGGIAGYLDANSTVTNTAALGESVSTLGGSTLGSGTQNAARVYDTQSDGSGNNNYAYRDMKILNDPYWGADSETGSSLSSTSDISPEGKDALITDLVSVGFWLDPAGLGFNNVSSGMGGITNTWNFAGIEGRGYPLLRNTGGQ